MRENISAKQKTGGKIEWVDWMSRIDSSSAHPTVWKIECAERILPVIDRLQLPISKDKGVII